MKKAIAIILSIMLVLGITFPAAALSTIAVKSIKLNNSKITLKVGQTSNLKVTFTPANTSQKKLTYVTGNKKIANVDATGKITAVSAGTAIITVYTLNKKVFAKCNVTISQLASNISDSNPDITPLGKYSPAIKMTVGQFVANASTFPKGESPENNVAYKIYENTVGIKFIPTFTAAFGEPYHQKLKLSITSGDIPDVSFCDIAELELLIKSDMIEDMTPYIEKYSSEKLKNILNYNNKVALSACKKNGKIYAIPSVLDSNSGIPVVYIRSDWLKNLNLELPKTLDELFAIAKAFTNNDPDKNGKNDTIGFGMYKELGTPFHAIMNAFGAYPGAYIKDDKGKIVYGGTQPIVKTALQKMNALYNDGIFSMEFATLPATKIAEKVASGKLGIYIAEFWHPLADMSSTIKNVSGADWTPIIVPGSNGSSVKPLANLNVSGYYYVKKGYKHPEALVVALNHFIQGDSNPMTDFYKAWDAATKNPMYKNIMLHSWLPIFIDKPDKNNTYSEHLIKAIKANDSSKLVLEEKDLYDKIKAGGTDNWAWGKIYLESLAAIKNYKGYTYNAYLGAPTKSMISKGQTLAKLESETLVNIITGNKPLSYFDEYVSDWNKLGGEEILDEIK